MGANAAECCLHPLSFINNHKNDVSASKNAKELVFGLKKTNHVCLSLSEFFPCRQLCF